MITDHYTCQFSINKLIYDYDYDYDHFIHITWQYDKALQMYSVMYFYMYQSCYRSRLLTARYIISLQTKPLGVIWGKFEEYSSKNTIMFDDLRRNFLMNPQNGLKVNMYAWLVPFYNNSKRPLLWNVDKWCYVW